MNYETPFSSQHLILKTLKPTLKVKEEKKSSPLFACTLYIQHYDDDDDNSIAK